MSAAAVIKATRCLIHRATPTLTRRDVPAWTVGAFPSRRTLSAGHTKESVELRSNDDSDDENKRTVAHHQSENITVEMKPWNPAEKRSGALAMKVGMMSIFDSWGIRHAVTVLQLDECHVLQVKTDKTDGYTSVQLGVGESKPKNVSKPRAGQFNKAGVKPKRKVMEFRVTPDALLPMGFQLSALHFVPGQQIDACGISKGKGFQGGMKRWGFSGQGAAHGVSKTHRHIGSTGQCQDPGKVFKGKKMPGRMGHDRVTVQNLKILKIDPVRDLLYVKGHIPGQNGGFIRVTDAIKRPMFPKDPPFPTYVTPDGEKAPTEEVWCPQGDADPLNDEVPE